MKVKVFSPVSKSLHAAEQVLRRDGHDELADAYQIEAATIRAHDAALMELSLATKVGAALSNVEHGACFAEWLVGHGWTPPATGIQWETDYESEAP